MLLIAILFFILACFSNQISFDYEYLIISNFIILIVYIETSYGSIIYNEIKTIINDKFLFIDNLLKKKIEDSQNILDEIEIKNNNIGYNLSIFEIAEQEFLDLFNSLYIQNYNKLLISKEEQLYKILTEYNMPRDYKEALKNKSLYKFFTETLPKVHDSFTSFKNSIKDK